MKPTRSSGINGRVRQGAVAVRRIMFVMPACAALCACEQNSFVPPPPPKVDVGLPVQQNITRFLDATGNTAPIQTVDLVARVQGVLQSINYKDGSFVKQGTTLFTIEPDTYKFKLEQAQAAEAGAQASVRQAEADYKRQVDLVARQAVSQATLDTSTSSRDNAQANLQQAQANTKIAAVNFGYTNVVAPFDGIVSAHLVSVGELVGAELNGLDELLPPKVLLPPEALLPNGELFPAVPFCCICCCTCCCWFTAAAPTTVLSFFTS